MLILLLTGCITLAYIRGYMNTKVIKYGFRPREAANAIGSEGLFRRIVADGWIKPIVQQHKITIYDGNDVEACMDRLRSGELPNPVGR